MSSFFSSLRVRIILIVLVVLLPAWVMMLFSISRQRTIIEADVMNESLRAAELAANNEEQVIEGARQMLITLKLFFQAAPGSREECHGLLHQLVGEFRRYVDLGAVNRQGEIFCSARPNPGMSNVAGSPWFERARKSSQFALGDCQAGMLAGKPVLMVTKPVAASDNRVETVLFAAVDLDWLDDSYVPERVKAVRGAFFMLVDRNGAILSQYPEPPHEMTPLRDDSLLKAIRQEGSRVLIAVDSRGAEYVCAVSPIKSRSSSRAVRAVLGIPTSTAFAGANRSRNLNLALLGGVSVFMIAAFWMAANRIIVRRLSALFATARSLTAGDLKARSGLLPQDDELGHFVKAFDEMAEALERREHAHWEAEARIRSSEEQLRRLQIHVQQVREEEQLRLAREIHDDLGQALTALRIDLSRLRKKTVAAGPKAMQEKLDTMAGIVDDAMNTVHHISSALRPRILDDLGLAEAIAWQAEEFQRRTGISCDVTADDAEPDLPSEQATGLFRIFQEALTNVARHSGATRVTVSLELASGTLVLLVADDGRGIRPEEIANPLSYGLLGIRERVHAMAGEVEISGEAGAGTRVKVSIPLLLEATGKKAEQA